MPAELKDKEVTSVARGADGETLFLADQSVWVMKDDGAVKRVAALKPLKNANDLFVVTSPGSPLKDWMFVSGAEKVEGEARGHGFYVRKPGEAGFSEVFCRRVSEADCGCFTANGRFFFAGNREIWEGGFTAETGTDGWKATLVGARIAPVAIQNTDYANAGSMDVGHLAVAGKWIYAGLRGHHMGCVLRTPVPAKTLYNEASADTPDPKAQLNAMRDALAKTEIIAADTGVITAFCACEVDGHPRLFYRDGNARAFWIWEGTGEPKKVGEEPQDGK